MTNRCTRCGEIIPYEAEDILDDLCQVCLLETELMDLPNKFDNEDND